MKNPMEKVLRELTRKPANPAIIEFAAIRVTGDAEVCRRFIINF